VSKSHLKLSHYLQLQVPAKELNHAWRKRKFQMAEISAYGLLILCSTKWALYFKRIFRQQSLLIFLRKVLYNTGLYVLRSSKKAELTVVVPTHWWNSDMISKKYCKAKQTMIVFVLKHTFAAWISLTLILYVQVIYKSLNKVTITVLRGQCYVDT